MNLLFAPCSVAPPYATLDPQLAAQALAVALAATATESGAWVREHDNVTSKRHAEAGKAARDGWARYYALVRSGELVSYVRDRHSVGFLRVPPEYYLDDEWGAGRCFTVNRFRNDGIPDEVLGLPIFVLQSDVEAIGKPVAVNKRGPKARYDAPMFVAAAVSKLEYEGGYNTGDFLRPDLRAFMLQWCADNWDKEPGMSWVNEFLTKAEQAFRENAN